VTTPVALQRPLINLLFTGYLGLLMAAGALELGEREYSWRHEGKRA